VRRELEPVNRGEGVETHAPSSTVELATVSDWKTVYFTSRINLSSLNVKVPGIPVPVAKTL
jgi:hypothetical protein